MVQPVEGIQVSLNVFHCLFFLAGQDLFAAAHTMYVIYTCQFFQEIRLKLHVELLAQCRFVSVITLNF